MCGLGPFARELARDVERGRTMVGRGLSLPQVWTGTPGAPAGGATLNPMGPMWLPPTSQELLAKCPFDGHTPHNDVAKAMLLDGRLLDTRRNDSAP